MSLHYLRDTPLGCSGATFSPQQFGCRLTGLEPRRHQDRGRPPSLEGVRVWEATSGKLIRALQDPGVEAVGWGPGRNLVASTTGRAIRFWDTETWECSAKVPLTGSRTAPM